MESVSWARNRASLEQDLGAEEYQQLLGRLQQGTPFLRLFGTWSDVVSFMRSGTSADPRKDEVLRPIFAAHTEDQDPRWRAILLVIFWPGLASIHGQKRGWDADPRELWQNIVWTFLQVVCRVDAEQYPERLVQRIFNNTVHRLHDGYRRIWNHANRELAAGPEAIIALAGRIEGINFAGIELRERQGIEIQRLREHLETGRINEADFFLLIGTRVYGQSVADYAREEGLDYQMIKKRRQRAEAVICQFDGRER